MSNSSPAEAWSRLQEILRATPEYEQRLDAALAEYAQRAGLPDSYLYLLEPGGRRFHLERTRARPALDDTRASPTPMTATPEGGVEFAAPTPALELTRTGDDERARVVASAIGRLSAVPLRVDGELVGTVMSGPVGRDREAARSRKGVAGFLEPFTAFVLQARREHELRTELAALAAREEAGRRLRGSALELDSFVELLLDLAVRATRSEAGFVAIAEHGRLRLRSGVGLPEGFAERVDLDPDSGLFDWMAAEEGGALLLRDVEAAAALAIDSILAVPLVEGGERLGLMAVVSFGGGASLDVAGLDLLETFADQIRLMLHNDRLFHDFSDRYLETVMGLARSLDMRREHTHGHHEKVSLVAAALARELDLAEDEQTAIATAGLIHDVGMAGILGVEGGLEADVEHPTVGASLVEHLPLHPAVAASIATHHEWFDGWGFPRGLRDEQIPLPGRVMAAAEFVVEMGSGDPIRPPWPAEKLMEEVRNRRGSQFDPAVADAAIRVLGQEGQALLSTGEAGETETREETDVGSHG